MRQRYRDTNVLPIIKELMPDATFEEQLKTSLELWQFFDGLVAYVLQDKAKKEPPPT